MTNNLTPFIKFNSEKNTKAKTINQQVHQQKQSILNQSSFLEKWSKSQASDNGKRISPSTSERLKTSQFFKPKQKQSKLDIFFHNSQASKNHNQVNIEIKSPKQLKSNSEITQRIKRREQANYKQTQQNQIQKSDKTKLISKPETNNSKFSFLKSTRTHLPKTSQVNQIHQPGRIRDLLLRSMKKIKDNRVEAKLQPTNISSQNQVIIDLTESSPLQAIEIENKCSNIHEPANIKMPDKQSMIVIEVQEQMINFDNGKKQIKQNPVFYQSKSSNLSISSISSRNKEKSIHSSKSNVLASYNISTETQQSFPKIKIKSLQLKDKQKYFWVIQSNQTKPKLYKQQYILRHYVYEVIDFYENRTKFIYGGSEIKNDYQWL